MPSVFVPVSYRVDTHYVGTVRIHSLHNHTFNTNTRRGGAWGGRGGGAHIHTTQLDRVNQIYIESSGFLLPLDNIIINNQMIYYLLVFHIIFNV